MQGRLIINTYLHSEAGAGCQRLKGIPPSKQISHETGSYSPALVSKHLPISEAPPQQLQAEH
jgi:hypothetical protein